MQTVVKLREVPVITVIFHVKISCHHHAAQAKKFDEWCVYVTCLSLYVTMTITVNCYGKVE